MQKVYVIPSKSIKKKLRFPAQPVWNKMQGLFLLITQIEVRISLKHFGFFIGACLLKSIWLHFFHGSAIVLSRKLLLTSKLLFLVTRTNEEIGRYNFRGIGYVTSPLSSKFSRIRNKSVSFRQKVDFHRYSCYNLTFSREIDPFLRAKRHKNCSIKYTLQLWYY